MKWTKEKPTKPGWYWWRRGNHCQWRIAQLKMHCSNMHVYIEGQQYWHPILGGEWVGPIPGPEEVV